MDNPLIYLKVFDQNSRLKSIYVQKISGSTVNLLHIVICKEEKLRNYLENIFRRFTVIPEFSLLRIFAAG